MNLDDVSVLISLLPATSYLEILKPISGQVMDSPVFVCIVNLVGMTWEFLAAVTIMNLSQVTKAPI